jgi:hypothetical protein
MNASAETLKYEELASVQKLVQLWSRDAKARVVACFPVRREGRSGRIEGSRGSEVSSRRSATMTCSKNGIQRTGFSGPPGLRL